MKSKNLSARQSAPLLGCWPFGRLAVWPFGRMVFSVLCCGGLLMVSALPSQADWVVDGTEYQDGKTQTSADAYSGYVDYVKRGDTFEWGKDGVQAPNTKSIDPRGSAGFTHHTGQVRMRFRYVPRQIRNNENQLVDDPSDLVPPVLSLKVTASGSAKASDGGRTPEEAEDAARYGRSFYVTSPDAYKVKVQVLGQEATPVRVRDEHGTSISAKMEVKRLLQIKTNGEALVFTSWCDILAEADVSGSDRTEYPYGPQYRMPVTGTTEAGGSYNANLDNRKVNLTREGAPTAFPDSYAGLVKSRDEWVEADGTGHGHTLASYYNYIRKYDSRLGIFLVGEEQVAQPVQQTINVNRSGDWAPAAQRRWWWSSSVSSSTSPQDQSSLDQQNETSQTLTMPQSNALYNSLDGSRGGWSNHPSSKAGQKVLSNYRLRDLRDDAVATASYELTLHDQWENPVADPKSSIDLNSDGTSDEGYSIESRYSVPTKLGARGHVGETYEFDGGQPGFRLELVDRDDPQMSWQILTGDSCYVDYHGDFTNGFALKDWVNTGGSDKTREEVDLAAIAGTSSPSRAVFDAPPPSPPGTKFAPVVAFELLRRHILVNKFDEKGWVMNPSTTGVDPEHPLSPQDKTYGKWPQAKDESFRNQRPEWLILYPDENTTSPRRGQNGVFDSQRGRS